MYANIVLPNINIDALNALSAGSGGMMTSPPAATNASVASTVASRPVSTNTSTSTAYTGPPSFANSTGASRDTTGMSPISPEQAAAIQAALNLSGYNLSASAGASGMMGVPGATSYTITNPYAPPWALNPDTDLTGATDIFGGRTYSAPSSTIDRARVGYSEMLRLNQTPGYITTIRREAPEGTYLPYRPSGEGENVRNDVQRWHEYFSDNEDLRKYLSADEQTELAYLDLRQGRYTPEYYNVVVRNILNDFGLPQRVGFKDFEAHFSQGMKKKRQTDDPYSDLLRGGASIGGYWNPENDPSDFQKAMANPLVGAVATTIGSALGGPIGAAIASGATTKLSGADWEDALTSAALAGGSAYLAGQMAGPKAAPTSEFNIPNTNFISDSLLAPAGLASPPSLMPLGGINTSLIKSSFLAPTAASAIANPALNLAAPSFFSTALGQGLGKAGLTLASGGDIEDALTAGVLGYAGAPGGLLSATLGSAGANFGTSQIGQALNNLSVADALKFGIKLPEEQWSAVGSLFGDLDLGSISEYGAFNALPSALQTALSNVKLSDVLENVGGVDYGSLLNIAYDVKLPGMESGLFSGLGLNLPNAPEWLKGIYGSAQDIFQNLPDINFPNMNISDFNIPNIDFSNLNVSDINFPNLDVPNINVPDFNVSNINTPNFNVPNINIPNFNVPNVNTNNLDVSNVNTPNLDLLSSSLPSTAQQGISGFGGLFGGGGEGAEAEPFMAKVVYDPRLQQLTPIAYSDPLSILLAEFYRTKRQA